MTAFSPFGDLLRNARQNRGISRSALASMVGFDPSHLYRIETGGRRPSRDAVLALADVLAVPEGELQQWLIAAGYAPLPLLGAVRQAVRMRGGPSRATPPESQGSPWGGGTLADRLESFGLTALASQRLWDALARVDLARQQEVAGWIRAALAHAIEVLESPVATAVIPIAGRRERLLAPHVVQRLLLSVIAEAAELGVTELVLVLAPGSREMLFDPIEQAFKAALAPRLRLEWVEQVEPVGLGDAVLCAAPRVGERPFVVLLPDDLLEKRAARPGLSDCWRMRDIFGRLNGAHLIAVKPLPRRRLAEGGVAVLGAEEVERRVAPVLRLAEKPEADHPILAEAGLAGIVGRYFLRPEVFPALEQIRRTGGSPVELTDALEQLRSQGARLYAYTVEGERRDLGGAVERLGEMVEISRRELRSAPRRAEAPVVALGRPPRGGVRGS